MHSGKITGATRDERAAALAGALAECGITRIEAESSYCSSEEIEARATDLPGYLRDKAAPVLRIKGTHIAVLADCIEWATYDREVHEAMVRAGESLK